MKDKLYLTGAILFALAMIPVSYWLWGKWIQHFCR